MDNNIIQQIREDWNMRDGKTISGRQRASVYTRTMGYYSLLDNMNIGKKSEMISRKYFSEQVALSNKDFIQQYDNKMQSTI